MIYHLLMENLSTRNRISFDRPATYKISVQGRIDPDWSTRLEGMEISLSISPEYHPITTLIGELRDQAALAGVLYTLYELLHLPLLSVLYLTNPQSNERSVSDGDGSSEESLSANEDK